MVASKVLLLHFNGSKQSEFALQPPIRDPSLARKRLPKALSSLPERGLKNRDLREVVSHEFNPGGGTSLKLFAHTGGAVQEFAGNQSVLPELNHQPGLDFAGVVDTQSPSEITDAENIKSAEGHSKSSTFPWSMSDDDDEFLLDEILLRREATRHGNGRSMESVGSNGDGLAPLPPGQGNGGTDGDTEGSDVPGGGHGRSFSNPTGDATRRSSVAPSESRNRSKSLVPEHAALMITKMEPNSPFPDFGKAVATGGGVTVLPAISSAAASNAGGGLLDRNRLTNKERLRLGHGAPYGPISKHVAPLELQISSVLDPRRRGMQDPQWEDGQSFGRYDDDKKPAYLNYLTPQEIRERRMGYDASTGSWRRKASIISADDTDGRRAWKPSGATPINYALIMENRRRAKELAERTRRELLDSESSSATESEFDLARFNAEHNYVYISDDSIAGETVGPFTDREAERELDPVGYPLLNDRIFAHRMLRVMDRYETGDAPINGSTSGGPILAKPLHLRPVHAPKPQIKYPTLKRKQVEKGKDVELDPETPLPGIPAEEPKTPEPVIALARKHVSKKPPVVPEEEQIRFKQVISKFYESIVDEPLPTLDTDLALRERRISFINDFAILENRSAKIRENEIARILRDVDIQPSNVIIEIPPIQFTEMSWNLYQYLIAMLPDVLIPSDLARQIVSLVEHGGSEEHVVNEIKRVVTKFSREDYVVFKAMVGHLDRLGSVFVGEGFTLKSTLSTVFAPILFRCPSHLHVEELPLPPQKLEITQSEVELNDFKFVLQANGVLKKPPVPDTREQEADDAGPAPADMPVGNVEVPEAEKSNVRTELEARAFGEPVDVIVTAADLNFALELGPSGGSREPMAIAGVDVKQWLAMSLRKLAQTLLMDFTVNTAEASALDLIIKHHEFIFHHSHHHANRHSIVSEVQ
ncbi:hypothetical protein HK101_011295 [Irineochytrium annulatum]|nr:hypothetical protein HK101_011295 [Irineochytrium annulatum]